MSEGVEGSVPEPLAHVPLDAIAATAVAPSESTLSVILACQTAGSLSPREQVRVRIMGSLGKSLDLRICVYSAKCKRHRKAMVKGAFLDKGVHFRLDCTASWMQRHINLAVLL